MGNLGTKFFSTTNVAASSETTAFAFILQGVNAAYYRPTELKVCSPTRCNNFYVKVYLNGSQVDGQGSSVARQDGMVDIVTLANNIQLVNASDMLVSVTHFEAGKLHAFDCVLVGQGFG